MDIHQGESVKLTGKAVTLVTLVTDAGRVSRPARVWIIRFMLRAIAILERILPR